ncbi:hypothetical protein DH2020_049877 [Rehmannia glutinosa]|uniref:SBP-type domain-containing protein n=1 Tax=Rehmannia glutinosa TaxID=99300 RepID=A0ABR0U2J1_REHGL|nr:SQUAMOSA promoter-binding-like protein [Rehmannia glutinosa]
MESLIYAFEGRRPSFTHHTDFQVDGVVRSTTLLNRDAVENMGFVEPVLPERTRTTFLSNQCLKSSASTATLNSLIEFGTRFSGSENDEKLVAPREPNGKRFFIDKSSPESSVSAKRARITNFPSSIPTCQVHGCNKDLSSSKDYHKRHKVCDVHSKTAVVVVNGIQQRFCQQCSRFHILAEFDEGKRSCRKRLAGHNERRRKPQLDTYLGSKYLTTDASKTSLLFSSILPGGFFGLHPKLEDDPSHISQLAVNTKFGQSLPKPVLNSHCFGKHHPSKNSLDARLLSVPESSTVGSNSSCALSLLSAQSHYLLSNYPLISKENYHSNLTTFQNSADKPITPEDLTTPMIFKSSVVPDEISQNSDDLNLKRYLSHEGANTVDLLELSLHLQRVEQQKYSGQVKLENRIYCNSTYT